MRIRLPRTLPERREALAADVALQNELDIRSELLDPDDLAGLLPGIDVSDVTGASFCAEDGYFDQPQAVVEAFAEACRRNGVAIQRSTIARLVERPDGRTLERAGAEAAEADAVVVAAGYDAPALLGTVGVDLPIEKQSRYLRLGDPIASRLLEPLIVSAERHFAAKQLRNGRVSRATSPRAATPARTQPRGVIT